ncbi:quinone-dependent dihydroorotate dehydrogenase [soil metagenome]
MPLDRYVPVNFAWRWLVRPLLFLKDAEKTHDLSRFGFALLTKFPGVSRALTAFFRVADPHLLVRQFGLAFPNPVGLAAGLDKNADWFEGLGTLGFGFLELGTFTARGQEGKPKPRIFRLPKDQALINRMGFPNEGAAAGAARLAKCRNHPILGINIGKSADAPIESANADYLESFELLYPYASYFAINVSSPNTAGLRSLQATDALTSLLQALMVKNDLLAESVGCDSKPILVKIAPDLEDDHVHDVVNLCIKLRVAGIIVANTTLSRQGLKSSEAKTKEQGGLSGAPLTKRARELVSKVYRISQGTMPIIGVGGIMTGEDAWEMIRAGASLIQVHTGFIYGGPGFIASINRYLLRRLAESGKLSIENVIGEANPVPKKSPSKEPSFA